MNVDMPLKKEPNETNCVQSKEYHKANVMKTLKTIAQWLGRSCRIHQSLLYRGVRLLPPMSVLSVLDITLNNLIVRFQ